MFSERVQSYLAEGNALSAGRCGSFVMLPTPGPSAMSATPPHDIYQAAFEKALRDHELNRLFNPEYYEAGGGI